MNKEASILDRPDLIRKLLSYDITNRPWLIIRPCINIPMSIFSHCSKLLCERPPGHQWQTRARKRMQGNWHRLGRRRASIRPIALRQLMDHYEHQFLLHMHHCTSLTKIFGATLKVIFWYFQVWIYNGVTYLDDTGCGSNDGQIALCVKVEEKGGDV